MDSISISLKLMYCKGLQSFNFFQKLLVYVLVSIVSEDPNLKLKQKQPQRTPTDKEGDADPEWNYEMELDLEEVSSQDCDNLFIHFDIRHEGQYFGDKTIGEVRVPLKDVVEEMNYGITRFVSYEVRSPDGKPNGVLNFSYKVNRKGTDIGSGTASLTTDVTEQPLVHNPHHSPEAEIQNPTSQMQTISPQLPYPSLESEGNSQMQETYSVPQLHYPSPWAPTQYPAQDNYYPPPHAYYSRPPPPPGPPPPPPPPMVHGACYRPPYPYPPTFRPWPPNVYDRGSNQNWRGPSDVGAWRYHS